MEEEMRDLQTKISELRDELHAQGEDTDSPSAAALCETSAEVLAGLETAFEHYLEKSEAAWRK